MTNLPMDEIESSFPRTVNVDERGDGRIRISAYQRSEDTDRRDKNMDKLHEIRRKLVHGEKELPLEIESVGDVHTSYSQVYIEVEFSDC